MHPSEHPKSQHRNAIGLQRAIALKSMGDQALKLYKEGYVIDGDRILDAITEQSAQWEDGGT